MTTIQEKMLRVDRDYRARVEQIRQAGRLSDAARREDLQAAYDKAKNAYLQLADEYRSDVQCRLEETRKAAFSAPRVGNDRALDTLVYRDALDRSSGVQESRDLSDMLDRAEVIGDVPLARAVLYRAYHLGDESVVHAYFQKYPKELRAWDEFMDAAQEYNQLESWGLEMAVGVPEPEKPRELNVPAAPYSRGEA
jgi:hypothetical protein